MKIFKLFAILTGLALLSGCITVYEKYTIHKNGSGTLEYTIDMSEMYEMIAAFADSSEETESMGLGQAMLDAIPAISNIDGISNAELTGDTSKYITGVKFDFKNAAALNKAIEILFEGADAATGETKYVEIKGKTFTRLSQTSREFNKEALLGSGELDEETLKSMLESMKYNISVTFDRGVKKVTTEAEYTLEDNTVSIETDLSKMFDNADILNTTIKTK
jgi:hypothetical protein